MRAGRWQLRGGSHGAGRAEEEGEKVQGDTRADFKTRESWCDVIRHLLIRNLYSLF